LFVIVAETLPLVLMPPLLVVRERVPGDGAARRAAEGAIVDRDSVLGPVERSLADVVDGAARYVVRHCTDVAVDDDPEVVRAEEWWRR